MDGWLDEQDVQDDQDKNKLLVNSTIRALFYSSVSGFFVSMFSNLQIFISFISEQTNVRSSMSSMRLAANWIASSVRIDASFPYLFMTVMAFLPG